MITLLLAPLFSKNDFIWFCFIHCCLYHCCHCAQRKSCRSKHWSDFDTYIAPLLPLFSKIKLLSDFDTYIVVCTSVAMGAIVLKDKTFIWFHFIHCCLCHCFHCRGKVISHRANKLQMPFLANSIYSSDRFLERSINSCDNQINSCRH